jgi:RND family efflux transporter MFP subunit
MKQLYDKGSLSEIQWVDVQTKYRQAVASEKISKKNLSDSKLFALVSGYVFQKNIEAGQNIAPGIPVMKIVNIEQVKAKISVPESEISSYSKGDKITLEIPALGNKNFSGIVVEKSVSADPISRTYGIKALVNNPTKELLPGMIGNAKFIKTSEIQEITIPANVVQTDSDNRTFVWTAKDGFSQKVYITVEGCRGQQVAVSEGLDDGCNVIVEGAQKVSQGTKICYNPSGDCGGGVPGRNGGRN